MSLHLINPNAGCVPGFALNCVQHAATYRQGCMMLCFTFCILLCLNWCTGDSHGYDGWLVHLGTLHIDRCDTLMLPLAYLNWKVRARGLQGVEWSRCSLRCFASPVYSLSHVLGRLISRRQALPSRVGNHCHGRAVHLCLHFVETRCVLGSE